MAARRPSLPPLPSPPRSSSSPNGPGSSTRIAGTGVGASTAVLEDALRKVEGARVTASPAGARIDVPSERDVDAALAIARGCGARLVSVQPVRQSLEDLFVIDGTRALHAD